MVLRFRGLGRSDTSLVTDAANLAGLLGNRPSGLRLDADSYRAGDPLALAYWPLAKTNNFQGLLYNQGWRRSVATYAVAKFDDMADLPWGGPMACHFHWLASIEDEEAIRRFETVLRRLKDQRRSIVWTVHNVLPHDQVDIARAVRVRRIMVEAADLIHVMNERTAELVQPHFSLDGKRVFYSPHPSYLGDHPHTVTREEARFELGLGPETKVFLCFGAIQPYKGLEDLVAAAGVLAQSRPELDWTLIIAGIAKNEALVDRIRSVEALDRRLVLHPHKVPIEDVQYFFGAADYAVCPYRSSLNSGAAMLALTFGVPLIAPHAPAFDELIGRGVGIGYAPDSPEGLIDALTAALESDPAGMHVRAEEVAAERAPRKASEMFFAGLVDGLESGSKRA